MIAEPSSRRQDVGRRCRLAAKGPELVDLRQEAVTRALERLDRERAGDVGGLREPLGPDEPERGEGAHELRPVHEREAFLRLQAKRLEARARERLGAREKLAVKHCPSFADERQREMRQRSEVAAGADRAAARHLRQDPAIEKVEQPLGDLRTSSRVPLRERVGAHEQRGADDLVGVRLADAARMAAQQPELELLGQLSRHARRDEPPESRGHAVGRPFCRNRPVDDFSRRSHLLAGRVVELCGGALDRDLPDVGGGEVLTCQADHGRLGHRVASLALVLSGRAGGARARGTSRTRRS